MHRLLLASIPCLAMAIAPRPAAAASLALAEALLERGDVAAALDEVKARVAEAPDEVPSHELLIDILFATGRAGLALDLYRGLAENNEGSPDFLYLLGRASPDAASSESAYQAALALDPDHARAWMGIGAVHRAQGQWTAAAVAYDEALRRDTSLMEAWTGLRSSHLGASDLEAAEAVVRRQISTFPDDIAGWTALAQLEHTDPMTVWQEAVSARPRDANRKGALARSAFEAGAWKAAQRAYDQAIKGGADDAAAMRVEKEIINEIRSEALTPTGAAALLGVRSMVPDNATQAVQLLDRLAEDHPHSGWVRLVRGNLYRGSGRSDQAEADLRSALDRMPSSPDAWSALGLFLLDRRRAAEARPLLDKAAGARPADVSLVVAAAMAAGQAGAVDDADARLLEAISRFPGNPGPVLGLARLRLTNDDADGAFDVLHAALRRGPEVSVAYALVSAAQEAARPEEALRILEALREETGDPRFDRAVQGLRAAEAARKAAAPPATGSP
ncbi:MAG: tetratricopeptide repeat protein [Myxococcota bacterium]|nr:tetratricopeptide repeat protein [Myxococcota bacterium]MEC8424788.1 tetratricopeptide repeat protein [Myxococcota bacterium]